MPPLAATSAADAMLSMPTRFSPVEVESAYYYEDEQPAVLGCFRPAPGPKLFGCLPLEPIVSFYALAVFVSSIVWIHGWETGQGLIAGWAWGVPRERNTFWLEAIVYLSSLLLSIVALFAIYTHQEWRESLRYGNGNQDSHIAYDTVKQCTHAMLLYFLTNLARFALFFPITGMALISQDVCGIHVSGLGSTDIFPSWHGGTSLWCHGDGWWRLAFLPVACALDGYVLYGTYRLWEQYRAGYLLSKEDTRFTKKGEEYYYGAADRFTDMVL